MKPFITLAKARTAAGAELSLHAKDTHFFLRVNREPLMATNAPESEREMARLALASWKGGSAPRVLIGGLGFGFTLHEVLKLTGPKAEVHVAELLPEVVAWNREFLFQVNGRLLDDPRVKVTIADVFSVIAASQSAYDAILLDVDNGPAALVQKSNQRIYEASGLSAVFQALRPRGSAAFWSASANPDRAFVSRLVKCGFVVQVVPTKSQPNAKRATHTVFLAERKREGA